MYQKHLALYQKIKLSRNVVKISVSSQWRELFFYTNIAEVLNNMHNEIGYTFWFQPTIQEMPRNVQRNWNKTDHPSRLI